MNSETYKALLSADDPPPVRIYNPAGQSSFLVLGDHAGNAVPARLETLGLGAADLARHIGWDIGIAGLGPLLAKALDAVFIHQAYSRLVVDCNRDPAAPDAMAEASDGTPVPANHQLTAEARAARVAAIHAPYQAAIAAELARRDAAGMATILVSLHSFTPALAGVARPWEIGILHAGGADAFALRLLAQLREDESLVVGDNQPYRMDSTDHTIPRHAFAPPRAYAEIEIRQDLLADLAGWAHWATVLTRALLAAA
ncbi:MAG: N-formylglutamate amidohydrolase [Sphingomonas sp.]